MYFLKYFYDALVISYKKNSIFNNIIYFVYGELWIKLWDGVSVLGAQLKRIC
jgi:hypothetical protein